MGKPEMDRDAALASWAERTGVMVRVKAQYARIVILDDDAAAEGVVEFSGDGAVALIALDTVLAGAPASARWFAAGDPSNPCGRDPATVTGVPSPPQIPPGSKNEKLQYAANHYINLLSSAHAPCTEEGNLACAWAVNYIVRVATGQPLGPVAEMLSTKNMYERLRSGIAVEIPWEDASPGDIVISPTGKQVGHVGILVSDDRICSNSSRRARWESNYTKNSWRERYGVNRGLPVKAFRLS
jgi:hypothetical protein